MKHLKKLIREDKILSFTDYKPTKYDGRELVDSMMLWLRNFNQKNIQVPIDQFLEQTQIDKDKFLTFVKDLPKTKRVEFQIEIVGDNVIFRNLNQKNNKMVWEESNESIEDKQLENDIKDFLYHLNQTLKYDKGQYITKYISPRKKSDKDYEIMEVKWDERGKNFIRKIFDRWPTCGFEDFRDKNIDFFDLQDLYNQWYEEEYPERIESDKFNF